MENQSKSAAYPVCLLFLVAASARGQLSLLNSVSYDQEARTARVTLRLDRPAKYRAGVLKSPDRIWIDLFDTMEHGQASPKVPANAVVEKIRFGHREKDVTRIVLDLREPVYYSVSEGSSSEELVVTMQPQRTAAPAAPQVSQTLASDLVRLLVSSDVLPVPIFPAESQAPEPTAPPLPEPPDSLLPLFSDNNIVTAKALLMPGSGVMVLPDAPQPAPLVAAPAAWSGSRAITIPRITRPPALDDFLPGGSREGGVRLDDFRQRQPGDGVPSSAKTAAYLSYDDQNLYAVFVCEDDPHSVRGRMSKREDLGGDDNVTVYLDTFHDGQRAYFFTVNPVGIQRDGIITVNNTDDRFDTLWYSQAKITADGYVALISIPFKSLRFPSAQDQSWGIALGRFIARNNEADLWPYITQRQASFVQQFAVGDGLTGITSGRNLRLIPYVAFTKARYLDAGPRYTNDSEVRGGLDAKLALRDALTLDLTVNPDFSQVESDDPQVTVNQRYAVFFREKRPFFLENINFFETPVQLFYSRKIVDPQYGGRLTGKLGRWNLGLLAIDDRAPASTSSAAHRALIGVTRIQREFRKDSYIGILATSRSFGAAENYTASLDMRLHLSPTWYLNGQAGYSSDRSYLSSSTLDRVKGRAYFAELLRTGRHFNYYANFQDYSKDFRAPLGFIRRTDIRTLSQTVGYSFRPPNSRLQAFGPYLTLGVNWDHAGRIQDKYQQTGFKMDFAGPWGFNINRYDAYEYYLGRGFVYGTSSASVYGSWIKQWDFYASFGKGRGLNYSPASGIQPFVGNISNASFGSTWRPSQRLRLEQTYYLTRLLAPRSLSQSAHGQAAVFVNHLTRTKLNYQFTRALSLRGILDYSFLSPNGSLFNSTPFKQFTGDILFTYLLNPGTAFYLGYNNRLENLAEDPAAPPTLRRFGPPTYPTSGQLYVKLSYLFRF